MIDSSEINIEINAVATDINELVIKEAGKNTKKRYKRVSDGADAGTYSKQEARKLGITHSTLPTKNK
jgi:hypothetical protein